MFEFSIEEGGSYFLLRIFERGYTSMRSVFMGKESANRFLFHLKELISNQSPGLFARTIREGDLVFIITAYIDDILVYLSLLSEH